VYAPAGASPSKGLGKVLNCGTMISEISSILTSPLDRNLNVSMNFYGVVKSSAIRAWNFYQTGRISDFPFDIL
jgi:hypothetical protein